MMESKGRFILPGLLFILAVLCHSGHSLTCYNCIKPTQPCTNTSTCSEPFDTCLILQGEKNNYFQCWVSKHCTFLLLHAYSEEKKLKYTCCQKDLCNEDPALVGSKAGKTAPLVAPLLAVVWRLCL